MVVVVGENDSGGISAPTAWGISAAGGANAPNNTNKFATATRHSTTFENFQSMVAQRTVKLDKASNMVWFARAA
jgi:hypothetical protein